MDIFGGKTLTEILLQRDDAKADAEKWAGRAQKELLLRTAAQREAAQWHEAYLAADGNVKQLDKALFEQFTKSHRLQRDLDATTAANKTLINEYAEVRKERDEARLDISRLRHDIVAMGAERDNAPKFYDHAWDEMKPVTQDIVNQLQSTILAYQKEIWQLEKDLKSAKSQAIWEHANRIQPPILTQGWAESTPQGTALRAKDASPRGTLKQYARDKLEQEDFHAVRDACVDLEVLDAKTAVKDQKAGPIRF